MTEFEKMISGQMYDAKDAGLTDLRVKARALLDRINASVQTIDGGERRKISSTT